MEYKLTRSKRKTAALSVDETGTAVVRAPLRMPKRDIDAFVLGHLQWIERQKQRRLTFAARFPPLSESEIAYLKEAAARILPEKVAHFSAVMKLYPTGLKITSAEKRFGSCSHKNSLCFSYLLMRRPEDAIDYVVVHELAHIRHKNHGAAFYKLIESVMPDYKRRKLLLL